MVITTEMVTAVIIPVTAAIIIHPTPLTATTHPTEIWEAMGALTEVTGVTETMAAMEDTDTVEVMLTFNLPTRWLAA